MWIFSNLSRAKVGLPKVRKTRALCGTSMVVFALATIYVYNHKTNAEKPCEDTIANCVQQAVKQLEEGLEKKLPTWDAKVTMEKA